MSVKIHHQFFELLQVALGARATLTIVPTENDWQELFEISRRQSVIGIAYHALEILGNQGQKPPRKLLFKWFTSTEKIKKRNDIMSQRSRELIQLLSEADIKACILKGQGLLAYYIEPLRQSRSSGDIDVYVDCSREETLNFIKNTGQKSINWDYKHAHLNKWAKTPVELHYRIEIFHNLIKNKKLQEWFKQNHDLLFCSYDGYVIPTATMNSFYVLLHIYRHYLSSGIGVRQLLDYFFVLRAVNGNFGTFYQQQTLMDVLKLFGMVRFAQGMMWVLKETLGMDSKYMFCEPREDEGRFILSEILITGNFGLYDHRIHQYHTSKLGVFKAMSKKSIHMLRHYPMDALFVPIWHLYHKAWKVFTH